MRKITLAFTVLLASVLFTGCAPTIVGYGKIDKTDKSIIIGGNGVFPGTIRHAFRQDGWKVVTQAGHTKTTGKDNKNEVSLNTTFKYKARYSLVCDYREYTALRINPDYSFNCTLFDNKEAYDIANFMVTQDGQVEAEKAASIILDWTRSNTK